MPDFIGSARFPMSLFERRLSDVERRVWYHLVALREKYGRVHVTVPGLAKAKGISPAAERSVKRALRRLREAGVVRDLGWRKIRQQGNVIEVYEREVYGAQVTRVDLMFPIDVWPKLNALPDAKAHGGSRTGTGKYPRHSSGPTPHAKPAKLAQSIQVAPPGDTGPLECPRPHSSGPTPHHSSGPPTVSLYVATPQPSLLRKEGAADAAGPFSGQNNPPAAPARAPRFDRMALLRGQARYDPPAEAFVALGRGGLPAGYHAADVSYTLPPPPRVPADDLATRDEQLRFIWKWYRAACMSRGIEIKRLGDPLTNVNKRLFEDAREVFLEKKIRPGVWVAWMLDRVLAAMPTNARARWVPVPKVVLSPKTLVERRWMFRRDEPGDNIATHVTSRAGVELKARFGELERRAARLPSRTPAACEALTRELFPEGPLEARRRAREKTQAEWQEALGQIQRGNWLWPVKG